MSVHDTGIGISQEDITEIFKAFRQVDSSDSRTYQGTGLGLAITRRLVEQMGGSIDVESEVGQGSVFSIEIPNIAAQHAFGRSLSKPVKTPATDTPITTGSAPSESLPQTANLITAFLCKRDAVSWLEHYHASAVRLQERSVPDEIGAWARNQLNDETVLGGSAVSLALNELQTGADNWDIVRMNTAWSRLDALAESLKKECTNNGS